MIYNFILFYCRLLLWDCDERSYSYYIEVSNNERDWEVVWDRSKVPCRSWQTITFPRRPIVYIRITGTYNTANEVFHCVHFECPAISTCTKSLGNNDTIDQATEEGGATAASPSSGSSEDETSSSTSENLQDEEKGFKRPSQRYVQSVSDNGIGSIQNHGAVAAASMPEVRALSDCRVGTRMDNIRCANRGKKRDRKTTHRHSNARNISYPHQSVSGRKHIQNGRNVEHSPTVVARIASDIASSRASVVTVAAVLDDVASTVANAAEQEEEQQQILQGTEDEVLEVESVANVDGDLVDVNDATETQSQISHHSSPASYAGSISGHSTAGVSANNSLPVGASACSMARQCQQEQFGYKQMQQGASQQQHSNAQTFNFRALSQQPPINDTQSPSNIVSTSIVAVNNSRLAQQPSPPGSGSPVSSPSSPAPNNQHAIRQSSVSF